MPRVEGEEVLALAPAVVWGLLNDPDTLAASIPGCRGFEREGDAEASYRTAITVAVGAVKGVYEGTVTYADVEEPERCTIAVQGRGDKGTIAGRGEIELRAQEGRTGVAYRGDFKLTGPVAGVGGRLAPGISRKMIVQTLRNIERIGSERAAQDAHADTAQDSAAEEMQPADDPQIGAAVRRPSTPRAPSSEAPAFEPFAPPWRKLAIGAVVGFTLWGWFRFR